jgi:hypothetical protein
MIADRLGEELAAPRMEGRPEVGMRERDNP